MTGDDVNLVIKDLAVTHMFSDASVFFYNNYPSSAEKKIDITFKDCILHTDAAFVMSRLYGSTFLETSAYPTLSFYGNTIQHGSGFAYLENVSAVNFYDNVVISDWAYSVHWSGLSAESSAFGDSNITNNATFAYGDANVDDFDDPVYIGCLEAYPFTSNFAANHALVTNTDTSNYITYNIPLRGKDSAFRITNDYNEGLAGSERVTYGAYSFLSGSQSYSDITLGISDGYGSSGCPYTYEQAVKFFNQNLSIAPGGENSQTSAIDGDVLNVKGCREGDIWWHDGLQVSNVIFSLSEDLISGTYEIKGWDVATNGSPAIGTGVYTTLFDVAGYQLSGANPHFTIQDFTFYVESFANVVYEEAFFQSARPKIDIDFKTIGFKTTDIMSHTFEGESPPAYEASAIDQYSELGYYGCTFDVSGSMKDFSHVKKMEIYDSVILATSADLDLRAESELVANTNLTNMENFTTGVGAPGTVSAYVEPTYNSTLISYLNEANISLQLAYFKDKVLMEYPRYGLPDAAGGAIESFRIANGYNTGLFGAERQSFGAYSFDVVPDTFLEGHIGAFYFGDDFENVDIEVDPGVIEIVAFSGANVDMDTGNAPLIKLVVPEVEATGFNSFPFDFSGTPRNGSSPLLVDFHVFNYEPQGTFAGLWEAFEFRWWFDYANSGSPTDYVSCATDMAEWLYCGFFGETYDVRCCVMYRPKE